MNVNGVFVTKMFCYRLNEFSDFKVFEPFFSQNLINILRGPFSLIFSRLISTFAP